MTLVPMVASPQAKEAKEEAAGPSALPSVTVDLNALHTIGVLDFDVPIRLGGKVDTNVNQVVLTLRVLTTLPPKPKKGDLKQEKFCDGRNDTEVTTAEWARLIASETNFSLVIPPLEPNKYYCLTFEVRRSLTADEQTKVTTEAEKRIREAFERPQNLNGLTAEEAALLRDGVAADIKSASSEMRLEFKKGSLFDKTVTPQTTLSRLQPAAQSLVNGQMNVVASRDNIGRILLRGVPAFVDWLERPVTASFFRELQQAATREQSPDKVLVPYLPTIKALLSWQRTDAQRLLSGDPTPEPPQPDWTGVRYQNRLTALKATETTMREVRELVAAYIDRPGATPSTVPQADLKALLTAVTATIAQLNGVGEELAVIGGAIAQRNQGVAAFLKFIEVEATASSTVFATSIAEFNTRHAQYVSVDLGLGFIPGFDEAFTFAGMNLYLRPVNKGAPLRGLQFRRRFAVMLGLTMSGEIEKGTERLHILGDRSIVAGAGFRFIDSLRLVGGVLIFKRDDPRPLVTKEEPAFTPFFALTIDWDAKSTWDRVTGKNGP